MQFAFRQLRGCALILLSLGIWLTLIPAGWAQARRLPTEMLAESLGKAAAVQDAIRQAEAEAKAAKVPTGLYGAKWLMTQQQVQQLLPSAKPSGADTLVEQTLMHGRPALALFHFKDDALVMIMISFLGEATEANYRDTQAILISECGPMEEPAPSKHARLDSLRQAGRFMIRHSLTEVSGVQVEQVQYFRTPPSALPEFSEELEVSAPIYPIEAKFHSAKWLEEGCRELLQFKRTARESGTPETSSTVLQIAFWLNGWMAGLDAGVHLKKAAQQKPLDPPTAWMNPVVAARSVLAFFKDFAGEIPPNIPATEVMNCWYQHSHPQASAEMRAAVPAKLKALQARVQPAGK